MKNFITPKLLHSRYNKCGGYHRSTFLDDGTMIYLTPQETAFGIYVKTIEEIIFKYNDLKNPTKQQYYQGKIDSIQELLLPLAESYIDTKKMKISYDAADFRKTITDLKLENTRYAAIEALLPYVIHFAALKKGLDFENPRALVDTHFHDKVEEKLVHCPKVKEENLIQSIGVKLGINPGPFLEEGKTID